MKFKGKNEIMRKRLFSSYKLTICSRSAQKHSTKKKLDSRETKKRKNTGIIQSWKHFYLARFPLMCGAGKGESERSPSELHSSVILS